MSFFDDASLVFLPRGAAGKDGKAYSIKPTDGTGDFSVVRATTATRVNPSGLIESVAANVPRFDYTNGGCGELLVEPQRTNLLTYSEDFSNAAWTKVNATISANATTAPDGSTSMDKIVEDATANSHFITDAGLISSSDVVLSAFVKDGGDGRFVAIGTNGGGVNNAYIVFNPATGIITETGAAAENTFVESYQGGIYRIGFYYNNSALSSLGILMSISNSATPSERAPVYNGDGVSGVFIWGAQVEAGSYATSYIPTSGSAVTRNQDVISLTNASALIGDSAGALFVEGSVFDITQGNFFSLSDGTNSNRVQLGFPTGGLSGKFQYVITSNSSLQFATESATTYLANNQYKIGVRYSTNNFKAYIDGTSVITETTGNTFSDGSLSIIRFGDPDGSPAWYGRIRQLVIFDQALLDEELSSIAAYASFTEIANANNYTING